MPAGLTLYLEERVLLFVCGGWGIVHVCHVMPGFGAEVEVRCGSCRRGDGGGGRSELGRTLRWAACVVADGDGRGRVKYDRRDVWAGRGVAVY